LDPRPSGGMDIGTGHCNIPARTLPRTTGMDRVVPGRRTDLGWKTKKKKSSKKMGWEVVDRKMPGRPDRHEPRKGREG